MIKTSTPMMWRDGASTSCGRTSLLVETRCVAGTAPVQGTGLPGYGEPALGRTAARERLAQPCVPGAANATTTVRLRTPGLRSWSPPV